LTELSTHSGVGFLWDTYCYRFPYTMSQPHSSRIKGCDILFSTKQILFVVRPTGCIRSSVQLFSLLTSVVLCDSFNYIRVKVLSPLSLFFLFISYLSYQLYFQTILINICIVESRLIFYTFVPVRDKMHAPCSRLHVVRSTWLVSLVEKGWFPLNNLCLSLSSWLNVWSTVWVTGYVSTSVLPVVNLDLWNKNWCVLTQTK
jgi:hypothetical protein